MKKAIAAFLLAGAFCVGFSAASPSVATDWKEHEMKRIEEQNKRRIEEAARARSAKEAEDKLRRARYEEERRRDLERKRRYEEKYGK